ncbi:MAG: 2-C-methyl-D-erythritol 4-phosphate cytidylyltransferase, partial [Nanoarchaeota archaeon]|nr:2-C-methyl-D-erythritol 4-phosphate cytidylyltransferase [Nanoarchaeota archaeon]
HLDDKPILYHTIKVFHECDFIDRIIVITRQDDIENITKLANSNNFAKVEKIIAGGEQRQDSVNNGLLEVSDSKPNDIVIVHNAANPFVSKKTIAEVINQANRHGAAAVGFKAKDTIKEVDEKGFVIKTIDREKLWQMQTPQAIKYSIAVKAFKKAHDDGVKATDDVSLVELIGKKVKVIESNPENIKVTTPIDLSVGRQITNNSRIGFGQDSHMFTDEKDDPKELVLGGVVVEGHKGVKANSDGDVILHSLFNALSQSVGGKSIGHYADPMCEKGTKDSREYLKVALDLIKEQGHKVNNIGIMLECATPKISVHEDKIKESIASLCSVDVSKVGITATSGEELTSFGKGLGIQAFTVVSVRKND